MLGYSNKQLEPIYLETENKITEASNIKYHANVFVEFVLNIKENNSKPHVKTITKDGTKHRNRKISKSPEWDDELRKKKNLCGN